MTRMRLAALVVVFAAAGVVGGCAVRSPSIRDIHNNPGRYYDRTVKVEGVVSSSWGVPLLPLKFYRIEDGTGELTVVSQSPRVPPKGARVEVKGRVEEFGTFGGRSLGLHVREDNMKVER